MRPPATADLTPCSQSSRHIAAAAPSSTAAAEAALAAAPLLTSTGCGTAGFRMSVGAASSTAVGADSGAAEGLAAGAGAGAAVVVSAGMGSNTFSVYLGLYLCHG